MVTAIDLNDAEMTPFFVDFKAEAWFIRMPQLESNRPHEPKLQTPHRAGRLFAE
jgi:hypothetical protein